VAISDVTLNTTFAQPNINDFLASIDWHIGKARDRAGLAVANVRAQGAANGRSGRTGLLVCEAIRKEFESGVEAVLGELDRVIHVTELDPGELRQHAVQRLMQFAVNMKAIVPTSEASMAPGYVNDQFAALDQHLQFSVRQYDVGFFVPSEPEVPQVSNAINIGSMTNSVVQQGSPGATQSVTMKVDEAKAAIAAIEAHSGNLSLPADKLSDLQNDIDTIKAQLAKTTPSHSIVGEAARSIRNVIEGAMKDAITPLITGALLAIGQGYRRLLTRRAAKRPGQCPAVVAEFTSRKDQSAAISPSSPSASLTGIR
jgi:hypothetical protein